MARKNQPSSRPQRSKPQPETTVSTRVPSVPSTHLEPKTVNQDRLLQAIRGPSPIVLALGAAGSGKSWAAVNGGLNWLDQHGSRRSKLVLSRAAVPTGRSIGFFPGSANEKLAPWLAPMISEFKARAGGGTYDTWLRSGKLELLPMETIRGRSFEDSVVLVDEIQSCTVEEIKSIVTRVGQNSKLILTGDLSQSDIQTPGVHYLLSVIKRHNLPIPFVLFEPEDVVRSDIVGQLVRAFQEDAGDLYDRYRPFADRS